MVQQKIAQILFALIFFSCSLDREDVDNKEKITDKEIYVEGNIKLKSKLVGEWDSFIIRDIDSSNTKGSKINENIKLIIDSNNIYFSKDAFCAFNIYINYIAFEKQCSNIFNSDKLTIIRMEKDFLLLRKYFTEKHYINYSFRKKR